MRVAKTKWRASTLRRVHTVLGLSCPMCLLAVMVSLALASIALGGILLDRTRTLRRVELNAIQIADLAGQRTAGLLAQTDMTLQIVAEAAAASVGDTGKMARLDGLLVQRRRAEPMVLGLYVLNNAGEIIAGAVAPAFRTPALAPACLRGGPVDSDQVALRPLRATRQDGGPDMPALCMVRGFRGQGISGSAAFSGSALAVLAAGILAGQYADLGIGPNGAVAVLDDSFHLLARISPGGDGGGGRGGDRAPMQTVIDPAAGGRQAADWAALARGDTQSSSDTIVQSRRVDGPAPAFVVIELAKQDLLAAWRARSILIGGGALAVVALILLSALAVRNGTRREERRLDRLAAMAAPQPAAGREALLRRLVELACEVIACEAVPQDDRQPEDPPPDDRLTLSVRQVDLVWIGPIALRRLHGGFSAADLSFLRVMARIADGALRHTDALQIAAGQTSRNLDEAQKWRQSADTLLSEMSDAMFTLDADWRFVSSNRNADSLFGEYPEDLRDRPIWDIFPELAGSEFDSECRRAVREQHAVAFSLNWMRGDKWLMVRAFPRPPGLAVYVQDVSRQVAADETMRQAAKMEAIGRLTGGIAHDFNNLLTVILGNTEILELDLPEHGELRDVHDLIKRAAQNAAELTHQLLAFGRRQPLSPSDVDVGQLILRLDGLLRRSLGPQITLELKNAPALWQARVDATQLENAIINLALNAGDAMPAGGRLTIETANLTLRRPEIDALGEIRPGRYVVISVVDTGIGIPKDILSKVFEPFFSTKPPGRGTGLGLSMIYGFVSQSGGHARISSEVGRGTTLRLYLPCAGHPDGTETPGKPGAASPTRTSPARAPALPGGQEKILVVEDAEMVRDYTQSVLSGLGYAVSVAADGREALAMIDSGLNPDLLLTDVLLPNGMDGLQVAEQALRRLPGLPVLYMSGYVENVDPTQSRLDLQSNLLLKPFRRAALAAMVRDRLDRGRGVPRRE